MLYFIASFNGDHVDKNAHSGGASKITFLVSLLRKIYKDVLIINTSINESHHKAAE